MILGRRGWTASHCETDLLAYIVSPLLYAGTAKNQPWVCADNLAVVTSPPPPGTPALSPPPGALAPPPPSGQIIPSRPPLPNETTHILDAMCNPPTWAGLIVCEPLTTDRCQRRTYDREHCLPAAADAAAVEELARSGTPLTPDASGNKLQAALAAVAATEVRGGRLDAWPACLWRWLLSADPCTCWLPARR